MAASLCAQTYTISRYQSITLFEVPISNGRFALNQIFVCCVFNEAIIFKCILSSLLRLFVISLYTFRTTNALGDSPSPPRQCWNLPVETLQKTKKT